MTAFTRRVDPSGDGQDSSCAVPQGARATVGLRLPGRGPRVLLLVLALVGSACNAFRTVKVRGVERAPGFSPSALVEEGVVIGAVACASPERLLRETSSAELASDLRASFLEEHPGMVVLTPQGVEQALGPDRYLPWTESIQAGSDPAPEVLAEIGSKLGDSARHLLLASVEKDEIERSSSDYEDKDANGKVISEGRSYDTGRETQMLFRLYDLETSTLEWKGRFETFKLHSHREEEEENDFLRTLEFVDAVLSDDPKAPPYPPPPSIQSLTHPIHVQFVETLFSED